MPRKPKPDVFLANCRQTRGEQECWEWPGHRNQKGYAYVSVHCKVWIGHRYAWTLANGPIPAGMLVLHRCDNPPCINPAHLFLGTHDDNMMDKVAKGRQSHLPQGEGNHKAKLTTEKVVAIRRAVSRGASPTALAKEIGVGSEAVRRAACGMTWKNVPQFEESRP